MNRKLVALWVCSLSMLISACTQNEDRTPMANETTGQIDPEIKEQRELVPLSDYVDMGDLSRYGRGDWKDYWFLANTPWGSNDARLLEFTSERYVSSNDAFERETFKDEELAKAKATLERFKGVKHLKVKWGKDGYFNADDFISINWSPPGAYNLDTQSFTAVTPCGETDRSYSTDTARITIVIDEEAQNILCQVKVKDLELAKAIEKVRVYREPDKGLDYSGYMYLDLVDAQLDEGQGIQSVTARLRTLSYEFWDKSTGALLGSVPAEEQID